MMKCLLIILDAFLCKLAECCCKRLNSFCCCHHEFYNEKQISELVPCNACSCKPKSWHDLYRAWPMSLCVLDQTSRCYLSSHCGLFIVLVEVHVGSKTFAAHFSISSQISKWIKSSLNDGLWSIFSCPVKVVGDVTDCCLWVHGSYSVSVWTALGCDPSAVWLLVHQWFRSFLMPAFPNRQLSLVSICVYLF